MQLLLCLRQSKSFLYTVLIKEIGNQYKCNYFSVFAILSRQSKSFLYTVLDIKGKALKETQYKCNYFSVFAILSRQSKSFLYTVLDLNGRAFKETSISATTSLSSPSCLANRRVFFTFFYINSFVFSNTRVEFKGELKQWVF